MAKNPVSSEILAAKRNLLVETGFFSEFLTIAKYGLLKIVIARNEAIAVFIFHDFLPPG